MDLQVFLIFELAVKDIYENFGKLVIAVRGRIPRLKVAPQRPVGHRTSMVVTTINVGVF